MDSIDTLPCYHSTLHQLLPREIWIKILDYVPLKQRLDHVQFVCQMFADICNSPELTELDFKDCVYMPDELCVRTVTKNQNFVRYMSFRDCTWFSHTMYSKFPSLNNLMTLDLTGVHMFASRHLILLIQRTPALQNLSLTIARTALFELISRMEGRMIQLKIFHAVVLDHGCISVRDEQLQLQYLDKFITSYRHNDTYSVSINHWNPFLASDVELTGERIISGRNCTIYMNVPLHTDDARVTIIRDYLKNSGLHCIQLDVDKRRRLDCIRYLSLPILFSCDNAVRPCVCDGTSFPTRLTALQYLSIAPLFECNSFQCFATTMTGILFECEMPKLTHLYFSFPLKQHAQVPDKIYQRLSSFMNMIELNLASLRLDLFALMHAIKDLNHLRGLALSVNESILNQVIPDCPSSSDEQGVASVTGVFLSELVTTFPNLRKLELHHYKDFDAPIDIKDLLPISTLTKLEHLIINGFKLINTYHFEDMWRNLHDMRSFMLCAGTGEVWEFANLTKYLHLMKNLTSIDLSAPQLPILETLKHLRRCKQLRNIGILRRRCNRSECQANVTAKSMTEELDAILRDCKLICTIEMSCQYVDGTVADAVEQHEENMRTNGRKVSLRYQSYFEEDYYISDEYLEDRFSIMSEVATCSPFDLFVR